MAPSAYVGNAKQAASCYVTRYGFRHIAYAGLETGIRDVVTCVISNGGATFLLQAPFRGLDAAEKGTPKSEKRTLAEIHDHLSRHGDAVKDVAFEVDNARALYRRAVDKGAVSVQEPTIHKDHFSDLTTAIITTYGDATHTLVEKTIYQGASQPSYRIIAAEDPVQKYLPPTTFEAIDNCVGNQHWGEMREACDFYENALAFHRFWTVDNTLLLAAQRRPGGGRAIEDPD
ncbi:MAG: hypothetical protein Q9184_002843 [Pyrenodesmia sp. 2 TL-2023]